MIVQVHTETLEGEWNYNSFGSKTFVSYLLQWFQVLRKAFNMFDPGKTGFIETNRVAAIFNTIEQKFDAEELKQAINEYDEDSK